MIAPVFLPNCDTFSHLFPFNSSTKPVSVTVQRVVCSAITPRPPQRHGEKDIVKQISHDLKRRVPVSNVKF